MIVICDNGHAVGAENWVQVIHAGLGRDGLQATGHKITHGQLGNIAALDQGQQHIAFIQNSNHAVRRVKHNQLAHVIHMHSFDGLLNRHLRTQDIVLAVQVAPRN